MRKDIFILAQKTMTTCFFWFFRTKRIFFNGVKDIFSWANNVLSPATIPSYQRFLENQNLISLRLKYQFSIFFLFKNIIRISITLLTTLKHPIINIKTQKKKNPLQAYIYFFQYNKRQKLSPLDSPFQDELTNTKINRFVSGIYFLGKISFLNRVFFMNIFLLEAYFIK